ncbi:conserved hypothetical protein [Teredinibacter turnerae T7901]|uniref:DUF2288 domain-containing protein n=1 Tax=Teredinibacter turnerae (strain ATCC 39867 / T7901) TaxID=377629 RepID=C5BU44_TERTT|nr:DUF2288 domain-containing protein [Teredinibacter turnerae]ACR13694.1 conserved hypothetical protein [Teredinibacter turnerae T7901]
MTIRTDKENTVSLTDKLNLETARIHWREIERFFAAGKAIFVAPSLDLIAVATVLHEDNAAQLRTWMETSQVNAVTDDQAKEFAETDAELWALVLAPWVLVQPATPA